MPLKLQTSVQVDDYTPYSINGETLVEDINDMVSYSVIEPDRPVDVQFIFGAIDAIIKTFEFKNLTKNQLLTIRFTNFDTNIFQATPNPLLLPPEQSGFVTVRIQPENMQFGITNQLTNMNVEIENTKVENNPLLTFKASGSAADKLELDELEKIITLYE